MQVPLAGAGAIKSPLAGEVNVAEFNVREVNDIAPFVANLTRGVLPSFEIQNFVLKPIQFEL